MTEHHSEPLWEALLYQLGELTSAERSEFERRAAEQDDLALTLADAVMLQHAVHAALTPPAITTPSMPTVTSAVTAPISQPRLVTTAAANRSHPGSAAGTIATRRAGGWAAAAACLVCLMMGLALWPETTSFEESQSAQRRAVQLRVAEFNQRMPVVADENEGDFPYELLWPAENGDGTGTGLSLLGPASSEVEPLGLDEGLKPGLIADMGDVPAWMLAAVTVADDPEMPLPERPQ